eukprot:SAG11_NODE_10443_length_831_cov_1.459016_1_plen_84_part_00
MLVASTCSRSVFFGSEARMMGCGASSEHTVGEEAEYEAARQQRQLQLIQYELLDAQDELEGRSPLGRNSSKVKFSERPAEVLG